MDRTIFFQSKRRKCTSSVIIVAWMLVTFLDISGGQDFRIDNQLKIQANDCYTRIAIGSRMPDSAVISTIVANSLPDCEAACSGNRTICNAFSFGIDARGNGTCRVGRMNLNTRGKDLVVDQDYDVYERRAKMPRGCQHDRLLRIGFGARKSIANSSNANDTASIGRQSNPRGNGRVTMTMNVAPTKRPQSPFGNPFVTGTNLDDDSPREASFFRGGWYSPVADDGDTRLYDIINNKKNHKSTRWKQTHQLGELPRDHWTEDYNSQVHSGIGIHEEDVYNDYVYRSIPFGGSGGENKWNVGGLGGSSPKLNEWNSVSNPKWNEGFPISNPKWTEAISGSNHKWNEGNSGSNPKWNEGIPISDTKWTEALRDLNPKLTEAISGSNHKWNEGNPSSNPKWIGSITGSNPASNEGTPDSNLKWTGIRGSNLKWDELNPSSNPKGDENSRDFGSKWNFGSSEVHGIKSEIPWPTSTIAPGVANRGHYRPSDGFGFSHRAKSHPDPVLEKTKSCYRKLMTGKRLADGHVRRNVQCSRIEDCHRVCEYESTFVCEGFNYGQMHNSGSVGRHVDRSYMCQLTSMSSTGMDVRRDFVQDPRYDYYERDWGCPASKTVQGTSQWSNDPRRPLWQPSGLSPSFERSPNEIFKRPQRPNDRYPSYANPGTNTRYYISEKPGQTIDRPNYHDYHSRPSNFPPQKPQTDVVNYHRPSEPLRPPPYLRNPDYHYPEYTHFQTRPVSQFPDRRYDQNSWHRPQQDTRPNEIPPDRNWHKPGGHYLPTKDLPDSGFYGSSYGYDSNRYDGRLPHRENGVRPGNFYSGHDKTRPSESPERPGDQPIDQGYNYGPAYGYDGHGQPTIQPIDSYGPRWKPQHHVQQSMGQGGWGGSRDCSVRSATGFKIVRTIVDASYTTGNLEECEMLCASRKDCRSFAYRYSLAATTPTDNCLLSTVDFSKLHFYTDLEPDRDYDIYAILGDPRNCKVTKKGGTDPQSNRRLPEECFWRMRSGFGMPDRLTRKELRVDHGLGECQIACVSVREFTCRSFVFRYESDQDRGSNCFLSDCPSSEIISENGARLPRIDQAELYERGSYGRGCEPYPFATIYNPANFDKPKPWTGGSNNVDNGADEGCYSGYQGGCRLSPYAVSSITRVDSETECRRKCSRMRNNPHTPCMSFSFKIGDEKRGDNCYLSDVLRKDLRPGLDYVSDDDYVMYAWKELEPQCSLFPADNPHNGGFYNDFAEGNSGSWSSGTATEGRPPPLGPVTGLFNYNHLVLGVRPLDSDRPDPVGPTDHLPHPVAPQNDDVHFPGLGPFNPDGFASFNRHYTVNGQPCKRGTKCERNQLVGFWSCEPEDSELGSWDYCCEPNHHCGFSEGFRYPWCYVGPSEDQWRPCSDKYFPYLPSPRPAIRPNQPDLHRPPYQLPGQTVDNQDSTTYHSRHWPIAYLHPQPPPNTTDSVALADDRRDDAHQTNESKDQPLTNKTRASVNETTNSPITHLQLHKSHLKRRGLVPANGTQSFSKYGVKKIRRITIIPPDRVLDLEPEVPFHNSRSVTAKPLASIESSYENGTPRTSSTNDGFEVIHLGATLPAVGSPKKRKGVLGRVERVTMSTRTITIDPQKREIKERTQRDIFSKDFGVIPNSADESSVYVPVPLTFHASNGSSRGSRTV